MQNFLKYTLATILGLFLFSVLSVGGILVLLIGLAATSSEAGPQVEDDSVLTINLSVPIQDSNPDVDPADVIGGALSGSTFNQPLALRAVLDAIEAAAEDDRIVGLYLYGNLDPVSSTGLAGLSEIRQALESFQATGKPILAYEMNWTEQDYYLSSVADTLVIDPAGLMELDGLRSELTFFTGALQKFGIGIQVIRAGRYKSAVEPFTRADRSPEEEQQTQQLLNTLWNEFLTATAESRELTPQSIQTIANTKGLLLANEAQTAGLVDRVAYFDEILPDLQKLTGQSSEELSDSTEGEAPFRQIGLPDYIQVVEGDRNPFASQNQIALVYAEGEIVSGDGSPGTVGGDRLARLLRDLRENDEVKAIVLRVNSPGGSAAASERVAREVQLTNEVKPVIVSMGSLAASGGYEISTYARTIYASPTTITGSIGVFGLLPNIQQLANNNGITWDVVKTGPFADSSTIARPRTPEELAIAQRIVDQIYDRFLTMVSESRSIPKEKVNEIAQGRVWSGLEAKQIGLVDELGGLEDAIQAAAAAANLGDDWQLEEYPKPRSFEEQLVADLFGSRLTQATPPRDPLTIELERLRQDLKTLQSLNDPWGAYTRLPFNPRID